VEMVKRAHCLYMPVTGLENKYVVRRAAITFLLYIEIDRGENEVPDLPRTLKRLVSRGKSPCNHSTGGWKGPRASVDDMEKIKFLSSPGHELDPLRTPTP
jgi:hypothetical protein